MSKMVLWISALVLVFSASVICSEGDTEFPCSKYFTYQEQQPGHYKINVDVGSKKLVEGVHGVRLTLLFDGPVKKLTTSADYEITNKDNKSFRLVNDKLVLQPEELKPIQISVIYEGEKKPVVTQYTFNGVPVCPRTGWSERK